tara:strand:+ start:663 stop:842 length:180 start_codon:yes stop_codon:yes gene_type:complete
MSVEYCETHHHYYDQDFVESCEYCDEAEEEEEKECKHCRVDDISYKGYCSRACYLYDIE